MFRESHPFRPLRRPPPLSFLTSQKTETIKKKVGIHYVVLACACRSAVLERL